MYPHQPDLGRDVARVWIMTWCYRYEDVRSGLSAHHCMPSLSDFNRPQHSVTVVGWTVDTNSASLIRSFNRSLNRSLTHSINQSTNPSFIHSSVIGWPTVYAHGPDNADSTPLKLAYLERSCSVLIDEGWLRRLWHTLGRSSDVRRFRERGERQKVTKLAWHILWTAVYFEMIGLIHLLFFGDQLRLIDN